MAFALGGGRIGHRLAARQHDEIVRMRQIEDGSGALVQHVGVEALRAQQRHIALEPVLDLPQARKLAGKHFLAPLEIGTGLQAVVADLQVIAEIAGRTAGEQRKDESREAHFSPVCLRLGRACPGHPRLSLAQFVDIRHFGRA
jgi:hypothetical protein